LGGFDVGMSGHPLPNRNVAAVFHVDGDAGGRMMPIATSTPVSWPVLALRRFEAGGFAFAGETYHGQHRVEKSANGRSRHPRKGLASFRRENRPPGDKSDSESLIVPSVRIVKNFSKMVVDVNCK
jgi:hypothetical protein